LARKVIITTVILLLIALNLPQSYAHDLPSSDPSDYIRPYESAVMELAREIGSSENLLENIRSAYYWTSWNIKYMYDKDRWGEVDYWQLPSTTIKLRTGDCEDHAILLTSLLRALGVSRENVHIVFGWIDWLWGGHAGYHAWVEVKIPKEATQAFQEVALQALDSLENKTLIILLEEGSLYLNVTRETIANARALGWGERDGWIPLDPTLCIFELPSGRKIPIPFSLWLWLGYYVYYLGGLRAIPEYFYVDKPGTYDVLILPIESLEVDESTISAEFEYFKAELSGVQLERLRTKIDLRIFLTEYRSGYAVVQIAFGMAFDSPLEMGRKIQISRAFTPYLGFYPFNTSLLPQEVPDEVCEHTESILEVGEVRLCLAIDRGEKGLAGFFDEVLVKNWRGGGLPFWNLDWLEGKEIEIPYYPDGQRAVGDIIVYGLKVKFRDGQIFEQPRNIGFSSGFVEIPFNQYGEYSSKSSHCVTDVMWFPCVETGVQLEIQPDLATVKGLLTFKWVGISDTELQEKWRFILSTWEKIAKRLEEWLACTQGVPIESIHIKLYSLDILEKSLRVEFEAESLLERSGSNVTLTLLNPFTGEFKIPFEKYWDLYWLRQPYDIGVYKPYFFSGTLSSSAHILVDSPKTVTACWKTQYYLTVKSDYDEPEGEGWYDEGSTATFSITRPVVGFIVQHVFTGWIGDSTATTPTATILMDAPKVVTANWRTDYTQLFMIIVAVTVGVTLAAIVAKRRRVH
jgi:uncharacterized repeat protein (TIGR02543 family)